MLLLAVAGSLIMFFVISLLFLLRINAAEYKPVKLPGIFWISTLLSVASSVSIQSAGRSFRNEQFESHKNYIGLTLIFGILFSMCQITGWYSMFDKGLQLNNNPSAAFIYLLSGLHLLHIFIGLLVLALIFRDALRNATYVDGFILSLNPAKKTRLRLVIYFLHFVNFLWLYLFGLFIFQQLQQRNW